MFSKELENKIRDAADMGVVTHYGDDLDNRLAIYALQLAGYIPNDIEVERTPAGRPVAGKLNLDVGDNSCVEPVTIRDDGTVIIDHHFNNYPNTLKILKDEFGINIPNQAIDIADAHIERKVNPLDYRSGLSLARYMDNDILWNLAEDGRLLDTLNDAELQRYGLGEAAAKQKSVIDNAVNKVESGALGKSVFVDEFVPGGSQVAYALGYDMYVSFQERSDNKATFAITMAPGNTLPAEVIKLGRELRDEFGDGVYINPDLTMLIVGGPKNPDFTIPISKHDLCELITGLDVQDQQDQKIGLRISGPSLSI